MSSSNVFTSSESRYVFRCCGGCVRLRQSRVAAHAVSAGPAGSLRHLPVLGVPHPSRLHVQRPGHGMSQGHRLPEVLRHQPAPSHRSAGSDLGVLYPLTFPLPTPPLPSPFVMKLGGGGGGGAGLYPLSLLFPTPSTSFLLGNEVGGWEGGVIPTPLPFHFLLPSLGNEVGRRGVYPLPFPFPTPSTSFSLGNEVGGGGVYSLPLPPSLSFPSSLVMKLGMVGVGGRGRRGYTPSPSSSPSPSSTSFSSGNKVGGGGGGGGGIGFILSICPPVRVGVCVFF